MIPYHGFLCENCVTNIQYPEKIHDVIFRIGLNCSTMVLYGRLFVPKGQNFDNPPSVLRPNNNESGVVAARYKHTSPNGA